MSDDNSSLFRQEALDRLQTPERLDDLLTRVNPHASLFFWVGACCLLVFVVWGFLGRVETGIDTQAVGLQESNGHYQIVAFVSPIEASQIKAQQKAYVSVEGLPKERYGLVRARVLSVLDKVMSREEMLQLCADDVYVSMLLSQNRRVAVYIEPEPLPTNPTGWAWTASMGPDFKLRTGVFMSVSIPLWVSTPVYYVFPFLGNTHALNP